MPLRSPSDGSQREQPLPTRHVRRNGFTLIELMIAMTVLAVGLLTVASAQIHAMRGARSGRHLSQAIQIAQSRMELVQRDTWAGPNLAVGGWAVVPTSPINITIQAPTNMIEQSYAVSQRVTNVVPGELRSVDVQVAWNEPERGPRSYTLTGLRFNYEGL